MVIIPIVHVTCWYYYCTIFRNNLWCKATSKSFSARHFDIMTEQQLATFGLLSVPMTARRAHAESRLEVRDSQIDYPLCCESPCTTNPKELLQYKSRWKHVGVEDVQVSNIGQHFKKRMIYITLLQPKFLCRVGHEAKKYTSCNIVHAL